MVSKRSLVLSTPPDISITDSYDVPRPMDEDETTRSTEEQEILDQAAEDRGEWFVEENEDLILANAERLNLI